MNHITVWRSRQRVVYKWGMRDFYDLFMSHNDNSLNLQLGIAAQPPTGGRALVSRAPLVREERRASRPSGFDPLRKAPLPVGHKLL